MEKIYKRVRENPQRVLEDCRNHIIENFNIDTIFKTHWIPLMEQLQNEILPQP